jgi:hypothetical protein
LGVAAAVGELSALTFDFWVTAGAAPELVIPLTGFMIHHLYWKDLVSIIEYALLGRIVRSCGTFSGVTK